MDAPAVAGSPDGKALAVAWMDRRPDDRDANVYWALIPGGFRAMPGVALKVSEAPATNSPSGKQTHPALTMDSQGNMVLIWEDSRPGWQAIAAATSRTGKRNFLLSDRSEGKASYPAVAAGEEGAVVVYEADRKVRLRLLQPALLEAVTE